MSPRRWLGISLILAGTILVAFSSTAWFRGLNNTPLWEFETGVGIRLSAPLGSFVRVPIAADLDTPMMLFYSNRRRQDAAFLTELEQLQSRNPNFRLIATMTAQTGRTSRELLERLAPRDPCL